MKRLITVLIVTLVLGIAAGSLFAAGQVDSKASDYDYVVGFNNMWTDLEFFQVVEEGLRKAAEENNIKLLVGYGERDGQKMMSNVDTFVLQGADLILDFNVLSEVGNTMTKELAKKDIPLIAIDGVYEGAYFYGVNNEHVGRTAGTAAAEYIKDTWNGQIDYVVHIYSESAGPAVRKRNSGASDVIIETFPNFNKNNVVWIDAGSHMDPINGRSLATDFLTAHPEAKHVYFQVLTDLPASGVLLAVEESGRSNEAIILSCDASGPALDNLRKGKANSWLGSVAAFPELYGENIIAYALDILGGKNPPKERFTNNVVITHENIDEYYPK